MGVGSLLVLFHGVRYQQDGEKKARTSVRVALVTMSVDFAVFRVEDAILVLRLELEVGFLWFGFGVALFLVIENLSDVVGE